jgi:hypothetical protein
MLTANLLSDQLSGNLVSISVGGIVSMTWSLLSPEDFDFDITRALNFKSCSTVTEAEGTEPPLEQEDKKATSVEEPSPDEAKIYIDENIARVDIPEIGELSCSFNRLASMADNATLSASFQTTRVSSAPSHLRQSHQSPLRSSS